MTAEPLRLHPPPPLPPARSLLSALSLALPWVQALRGIKNCVIGNKRQKQQYIQLGAVQLLVAVLGSPASDAALLVQAAAALGSFAASQEGLQVVLHHGGVPCLLQVLVGTEDGKVVEAAARALKAVCRVSGAGGQGGRCMGCPPPPPPPPLRWAAQASPGSSVFATAAHVRSLPAPTLHSRPRHRLSRS